MLTICPECDSSIKMPSYPGKVECSECRSNLIWTGTALEIPTPVETAPLRKYAPKINTKAYLGTVEIPVLDTPDSDLKCMDCGGPTDNLNSHKVKLQSGRGRKDVESNMMDASGESIMKVIFFPIFKDGRICQQCFERVEARKDSQSHTRFYLGRKQIVFSFEDERGQTRIPKVERHRPSNPTQSRKLDKGKVIPGTDITLYVDQTPDFPTPESEVHEKSFQHFGFSRGSRDYRKYIRG